MSARAIRALAGVVLSLPALAGALPVVQNTQAFTENAGPNPYLAAGWQLGLGASGITPSGAGTTVQAVHSPLDPAQDYTIPFNPTPVSPNQYIRLLPYTGQSGVWQIRATDGTGTGVATTHTLDDIRQLPLLQGLAAGGPLLTPTVSWAGVDPVEYPSLCTAPCPIGFDFFNYTVVVRDTAGIALWQSNPSIAPIRTDQLPRLTLPAGVLASDRQYLIGVRLGMSELERINPDGSFFSPLENRSTTYLEYSTTPVPEPAPAAMLLVGLVGLGTLVRRRRAPT